MNKGLSLITARGREVQTAQKSGFKNIPYNTREGITFKVPTHLAFCLVFTWCSHEWGWERWCRTNTNFGVPYFKCNTKSLSWLIEAMTGITDMTLDRHVKENRNAQEIAGIYHLHRSEDVWIRWLGGNVRRATKLAPGIYTCNNRTECRTLGEGIY